MPDIPARSAVEQLLGPFTGPCVSMYVPLIPGGATPVAGPAMLIGMRDNLQPTVSGVLGAARAEELFAPIGALLEARGLWMTDGSIAIFARPGHFQSFHLPQSVEPFSAIGTRFHLLPMIQATSGDGRFYVLIISRNHARLIRCTRSTDVEVPLPGVPAGLADTLKYDEFGRQPQWHPGIGRGGGDRGPIFHGQGGISDSIKEEMGRYCREIDRAVERALHGETAPMVAAGVDELVAIYRMENRYPALLHSSIAGSPDEVHAAEFRERAWPLVRPLFLRERDDAIARFRQIAGKEPSRTTSSLRLIVPAAHAGRVATLFVHAGRSQWGRYDGAAVTFAVPDTQAREDLLDIAAQETLRHRGEVYVVDPADAPSPESATAILRY